MNEFEELVDFFAFYQTIDREDTDYINKQVTSQTRNPTVSYFLFRYLNMASRSKMLG